MAMNLQLDRMTTQEKLQAMEALWDDLCRNDAVPVPQWHKDLLNERERLIAEGKAEFIEWDTAKKQIAERISSRNAERIVCNGSKT
jgi:hypothetical protein